jgi:hypothetical protein
MFVRILSLLALCISLGGCFASAPAATVKVYVPTSLSAAQEKEVRESVARSLKDPESARFGRIIAGRSSDGAVMVCGFVNAKNGFGGYTGEKPFDGLTVANGSVFTVVGIGGADDDTRAVIDVCAMSGLQL